MKQVKYPSDAFVMLAMFLFFSVIGFIFGVAYPIVSNIYFVFGLVMLSISLYIAIYIVIRIGKWDNYRDWLLRQEIRHMGYSRRHSKKASSHER